MLNKIFIKTQFLTHTQKKKSKIIKMIIANAAYVGEEVGGTVMVLKAFVYY